MSAFEQIMGECRGVFGEYLGRPASGASVYYVTDGGTATAITAVVCEATIKHVDTDSGRQAMQTRRVMFSTDASNGGYASPAKNGKIRISSVDWHIIEIDHQSNNMVAVTCELTQHEQRSRRDYYGR